MQSKFKFMRTLALVSSAAVIVAAPMAAAKTTYRSKAPAVRSAPRPPAGVQRPSGQIYLSQGRGQLITLPRPISDVFVSNESVADVRVQSPTQIYLFGKGDGETSVYATSANGQVIYSTNVRVNQNYNSLDEMLQLAMPDTDVKATMAGQVAVLTGTVKDPDDINQAGFLARAFLNPGIDASDPKAQFKVVVVNRLKTATPLQVTLQVRIAEVSRTFSKNFGIRFQANNGPDTNAGTTFAIDQGGLSTGTTDTIAQLGGRLLGLNILSQLDVGEREGFVTTLASPNLTALSGERASFLAGGEVPILISNVSTGGTAQSVSFKPYGIKVDFVPTVLAGGRISLIVQPEVSEIDRSVSVLGTPGFLTRKVDTTVELGSGQSFVIGGLLRANSSNNFTKLPGAGDVPVLGALFRSNAWQRGETELMIVVTPYLVNPVPASQIVLPTDGYRTPSELGRMFNGDLYKGVTERRAVPSVAPSQTVAQPGISGSLSTYQRGAAPAPGFSK